jgi:hypothetical protein
MKKLLLLLGAALAFAGTGSASAHPEHDDMAMARDTPLTLEARRSSTGIVVYVEDDGKPYPTAGARGSLTLIRADREVVIQLEPSGTNVMATRTGTYIAAGSRARAHITFADQSTVSAEVTIE